jgi:hypothetical protein
MQVHVNSLCEGDLFGAPDAAPEVSGALLNMLQPPQANLYARSIAAAASASSSSASESEYQPLLQPMGHTWLVIDAPLRGGLADRLAPLLHGQPVWCTDGTRFRIQHGQRLLWECSDLRLASPLTLSSVGVLCVHTPLVNAATVVQDCHAKIMASSMLLDEVS